MLLDSTFDPSDAPEAAESEDSSGWKAQNRAVQHQSDESSDGVKQRVGWRESKRWRTELPADRSEVDRRYKRCRSKNVGLNLLTMFFLAPVVLGCFGVAVYILAFEVLMTPGDMESLTIVVLAVIGMIVAMRAWSAVGVMQDCIHEETNILYRIESDLAAREAQGS